MLNKPNKFIATELKLSSGKSNTKSMYNKAK